MNTAAILKGEHLPASGLLSATLASCNAFDATSTHKLGDGTLSTPSPSTIKRAFNLIHVGQFALDIALGLTPRGSPVLADRVHAAADLFTLLRPGSGPNVLNFDTLAPVVTALQQANTARAASVIYVYTTGDCSLRLSP